MTLSTIIINVQENDFNQQQLFEQLLKVAGNNAGAVCTFTGLVREVDRVGQAKLTALSLEHYPTMTENSLMKIAETAKSRFSLTAVTIVHRVGKLSVGEQIVYVATASEHRKMSFEATQFIMDFLKNEAPFWKKEYRADGSEKWIEQKQSDKDAKAQW